MIINSHKIISSLLAAAYPGLNSLQCSISDPQPAFQLLDYTLNVNENGPPLQLILNISVRAESKEKTRADMLCRIISGLLTVVGIEH